MTIFNKRPNNWKDLQNYVGQIFKEIGYEVEISKHTYTIRGKKEIDVFVRDPTSEFGTVFLIECKFWNKKVTQETVHAFRTVMGDYSANIGFIVSSKGFQKGCFEAAKNTNIKLVTFEELEQKFYQKWQLGMAKKYMRFADQLFPYWDFPGKPSQKGPLDWNTNLLLREAYAPFIQLGPWDENEFRTRQYPQAVPVLDDNFNIVDKYIINNDREYFDFLESNKDKSLRHYQIFYGEKVQFPTD